MIGKSRNVGDENVFSQNEFKDAKVELFRNGTKFLDIPYFSPKYYNSSATIFQLNNVASKITDGATYSLKVSMAGYETVEAEQKVPTKPNLSSPIFKEDGFEVNSLGSGNTKKNLVQFDLSDPAEENFYTIALYLVFQDTTTKTVYTKPDYHELDQQFSNSVFDDYTYGAQHTVTDAIFNGKKFNYRMGTSKFFNFWDPSTGNLIDAKLLSYKAFVYGISKEKYLYEASLAVQDNELNTLFGEPVIVNSNIKNGFGIFSIRNVTTIDIPVK
jgi:hypothetical protein